MFSGYHVFKNVCKNNMRDRMALSYSTEDFFFFFCFYPHFPNVSICPQLKSLCYLDCITECSIAENALNFILYEY